jgi:hypothetical protein
MTWAETTKGQTYRHPDGALITVKSIRKTHAIVIMDYTNCTDGESSGVFEDRVALSHPVNPALVLVPMIVHVACSRCGQASPVEGDAYVLAAFTCENCRGRQSACLSCGQVQPHIGLCGPCATRSREPQGEAMRLFTPAPTQIAGQLAM